MRYVILRSGVEEVEPGHEERVDRAPLLCATRGQAETSLKGFIDDVGLDWSVWEVVDGRCLQRSVVFKDGMPEIQS